MFFNTSVGSFHKIQISTITLYDNLTLIKEDKNNLQKVFFVLHLLELYYFGIYLIDKCSESKKSTLKEDWQDRGVLCVLFKFDN